MRSTRRESVFILGCALLLAGAAGCASAPEGPPIEAPRLVAGDHWQYRVVDQLRRGAISRLDDAEFWRTRTTRRDAIWYAAEVKAPVREAREAEYTEIGGPDVATVRTESTVRELVSFRPGAR